MTVKEAIIKVLEKQRQALNYNEIHELIVKHDYIDWSNAKTPKDTTAAQCGSFIRKNDSRVKRIKSGKVFLYYLSAHEDELNLEEILLSPRKSKIPTNVETYQERDLHILFSSYLKSSDISSKTIYHEKSSINKDNHQKWIHPDMIGVKFLKFKNKASLSLLKSTNTSDSFELISYELKREIKTDYELKKCYFQTVSNSSWANYGYLVAFEISSNLMGEMARLNQSFGIGIINLKANPFESEILFKSNYKELDYTTIDKLCVVNKDFERFIRKTSEILDSPNKYLEATKKAFNEYCDGYFDTDGDFLIKQHCFDTNIPTEEN